MTGHAGEDPAYTTRRQNFRALTTQTRADLAALYVSAAPDADKRRRKAEIMAAMRQAHAALKAGPWAGNAGYDAWFAHANNASLGLQLAYDGQVGAFQALLAKGGGDLPRFYAEVKRLAGLPKAERDATLAQAH